MQTLKSCFVINLSWKIKLSKHHSNSKYKLPCIDKVASNLNKYDTYLYEIKDYISQSIYRFFFILFITPVL